MKRMAVGIAALAALIAPPALAADMAAKARPAPLPAAFNWSGFYVGGNIGYGWGRASSNITLTVGGFPTSLADKVKPDGIIGGAQIGYNWQLSPTWVSGLEADWQAADQKASSTLPAQPYFSLLPPAIGTVTSSYTARIDWFGTLRGRLGYTWGRTLLYATGGLAYGEVKIAGSATDAGFGLGGAFVGTAPFGGSAIKVGWTAGAGIESALTGKWTWKAEYLYVDLGPLNTSAAGPFGTEPVLTHTRFTDNVLRAGLNYHFSGP